MAESTAFQSESDDADNVNANYLSSFFFKGEMGVQSRNNNGNWMKRSQRHTHTFSQNVGNLQEHRKEKEDASATLKFGEEFPQLKLAFQIIPYPFMST